MTSISSFLIYNKKGVFFSSENELKPSFIGFSAKEENDNREKIAL